MQVMPGLITNTMGMASSSLVNQHVHRCFTVYTLDPPVHDVHAIITLTCSGSLTTCHYGI